MTRSRKGFTLIEILLVTALFSMVSIAIFQTFSSGVKLWQRSQRLILEQQAALFLDQIEEELHNTFELKGFVFKGTAASVRFPNLIRLPADFNGADLPPEQIDHPGMVEYEFDYGDQKLLKRKSNYGQVLKEQSGGDETVLSGVEAVRFSYLYSLEGVEEFRDTWEGRIPVAMKVEVRFMESYGTDPLVKLVTIPVGNLR